MSDQAKWSTDIIVWDEYEMIESDEVGKNRSPNNIEDFISQWRRSDRLHFHFVHLDKLANQVALGIKLTQQYGWNPYGTMA